MIATGDVKELDLIGDYHNTDPTVTALEARYFGELLLKGDVSIGYIQADGNKSGDVAINQLAVVKVTKLARLPALNGGIPLLRAGSWPDTGVVETKWITTLSTHAQPSVPAGGGAPTGGEFAAQVILSGARGTTYTSLSSASISGALSGLLQASGDVDKVTAGSISGWTLTGGVGAGSPGTLLSYLEVLKSGNAENLNVKTDGIGTIKVGGLLNNSSIEATLAVPVKLIKAGGISNTSLKAADGFQSIETNLVSSDTVTAGYVTNLKVTKGTGPNRDGSLTGLSVTLSAPQGVTRLIQADGPVQDLTWLATGGYLINRIQAPPGTGGHRRIQFSPGGSTPSRSRAS